MARIVYVCARNRSRADAVAQDVATVVGRLVPENLEFCQTRVFQSEGIVVGVVSPGSHVSTSGASIAVGQLIDAPNWTVIGSPPPDGSYCIFRGDGTSIELVADELASRTIWYLRTEDLFVASTSQRACVAVARSFELNHPAVTWMLATGSLGPGISWDKRVRCVPGSTVVRLDRRSWRLTEHTEPPVLRPAPLDGLDHRHRVLEGLRHVVQSIDTRDPRVALTLSGGVDSRAILCLLSHPEGLRAVTWGSAGLPEDRSSDAAIAGRLARHFGLQHRYLEMDRSDLPVDVVLRRFVHNGEARIDHLSGYADGFDLWRNLASSGIGGVIRGDHIFGAHNVTTSAACRGRAGMQLWSDYQAFPPLERLDLPPQLVPALLEQRSDESLATWRDRLYRGYRVPHVLAALTELKSGYVDVVKPLLSGSLVALARQLPDDLRTYKILLRRIVRSIGPPIPFAATTSVLPLNDLLRSRSVLEILCDTLHSQAATSGLSESVVTFIRSGIRTKGRNRQISLRRRLRGVAHSLSPAVAGRLRPRTKRFHPPSHERLALRAYLVASAQQLFAEDAGCLDDSLHSCGRAPIAASGLIR